MSLSKQILTNKPREIAGSKTSKKYNYQKDLSLFLLIEKHRTKENYVFLLDFHDDLLILDSEIEPNKIDFYQIKTKDKNNWTIGLLKQKEKDKLSILGKMFYNKILFKEYVNTLNFISNASYSFKELKDKTNSLAKVKIKGEEMHDDDVLECNTNIKKEHSLEEDPQFEKLSVFHVSTLSQSDSSTHCVGALAKLINEINPDNRINSELAYRQIFNEIKLKTDYDSSQVSFKDISELIEVKGISKAFFEEILKKAGLYKSSEEEWNDVKILLESSGLGFAELKKHKTSWNRMSATLLNESSNTLLLNIVKDFRAEAEAILNDSKNSKFNLLQLAELVTTNVKLKTNLFDEMFLKCLAIKILNEK